MVMTVMLLSGMSGSSSSSEEFIRLSKLQGPPSSVVGPLIWRLEARRALVEQGGRPLQKENAAASDNTPSEPCGAATQELGPCAPSQSLIKGQIAAAAEQHRTAPEQHRKRTAPKANVGTATPRHSPSLDLEP
jgi:hypothetical protein